MSALRAAAGVLDLSPVVGARLTGFALRLEPSTGVHDPLQARLLLLDDGLTRLLWIACDLIGFDPDDDASLRARIAGQLAMPACNVFVSCTHTHSGPSSMPFRGPLAQVDREWLASVFDAVTSNAVTLRSRLQSVQLAVASQAVPGIGFNRQDNVSPIDERLLVAQLIDGSGQVIATLLNYATHPVVLGDCNLLYTADFPGYATRRIEDQIGGVALFVQGSAGDVNPLIFRDRPREAGTFGIAEEMGRTIAAAAIDAMQRAAPSRDVRIRVADRTIDLPLAPPPSSNELDRIGEEIATRDPRWATFEQAWATELAAEIARDAVRRKLQVSISAARIGETFAVTFPLEIYSQIGLDVRKQFEPAHVIVAGYTNGLYGYAPTDRAIDQGGYGPAMSYRFFPRLLTPIDRGCAAILVGEATKLIRSLA